MNGNSSLVDLYIQSFGKNDDNNNESRIRIKRHSRESKVVDTTALMIIVGIALLKECGVYDIQICIVAILLFILALIYKYLDIKV